MNYEIKSIKYYDVHNTINNFDFSVFFQKGYFINGFFQQKLQSHYYQVFQLLHQKLIMILIIEYQKII